MLTRLVVLLLLPVTALAAPAPAPKPPPRKNDQVRAKGQTVLLGTFAWNVGENKLGGMAGADVWWEQVSDRERALVPQGGAGWAILKGKAFEKLALEDLRRAGYSSGKLPGSSLTAGTVVALRTRDGKFAKLKVVGYRDLHDASFPEAKHLPPGWIGLARSKPNVTEYHMEVNWLLYRDTE